MRTYYASIGTINNQVAPVITYLDNLPVAEKGGIYYYFGQDGHGYYLIMTSKRNLADINQ